MVRRKPVTARAREPDSEHRFCRVIGCPNPPRAATAKGLDKRFCRRHAEHYSRHGSPYKRSYVSGDLLPYRKLVRAWLKERSKDRWVSNAVQRVEGLYARAGPFETAFALAGRTPRERAWKAWARLRKAAVDPVRVIEAWLIVELAVRLDPQPDGNKEFKRVQAAKQVHRLASGSHKRWEQVAYHTPGTAPAAKPNVIELHKYPHSRGRVLRYIGQDLEEACEHLVSKHLQELLALAADGSP